MEHHTLLLSFIGSYQQVYLWRKVRNLNQWSMVDRRRWLIKVLLQHLNWEGERCSGYRAQYMSIATLRKQCTNTEYSELIDLPFFFCRPFLNFLPHSISCYGPLQLNQGKTSSRQQFSLVVDCMLEHCYNNQYYYTIHN